MSIDSASGPESDFEGESSKAGVPDGWQLIQLKKKSPKKAAPAPVAAAEPEIRMIKRQYTTDAAIIDAKGPMVKAG